MLAFEVNNPIKKEKKQKGDQIMLFLNYGNVLQKWVKELGVYVSHLWI